MPRSLAVKKEKRRNKRKLALANNMHKSYKLTVTEYFEKIESKIHAIRLSGYIPFKQLEEKLGPLEFDKKYYHRKNKKTYNVKYNATIDGFKIPITTEPFEEGRPRVYMQIIPPDGISAKKHKAFLSSKINDPFPGLNLSAIECATDIFFTDPSGVESAFDVIMKNVFIRKQKKAPVVLPESKEMRKKKNRGMKIGRHKIYERGKDKDRKGRYWPREDLDRVRMESTIPGRTLKQKKIGLKTLGDLLNSPKFYDLNKDIWLFRIFKASKSKNLPDELDDYPHETYQGEQFLARKREVKNLDRSFVNDWGLDWFKMDLLDAMKYFDMKW
jgi:hypothetical protein